MYDSISCKFPLEFLFEPAEMHKDWYKEKREAEEKKKTGRKRRGRKRRRTEIAEETEIEI